MLSNDKLKLLVFTGPSGCGKSTLIDVYCRQNKIPLVNFKPQTESKFYSLEQDMRLERNYMGGLPYPDDLEELLHFMQVNSS